MAPKKKAVKKAPSVGLRGKKKSVPPAAGLRPKYRMLKKGETVVRGDENWAFGEGPWTLCERTVGLPFDPDTMFKIRREVVKRRGK